ncbi:hypothetical protein L210DRAFT_3536326 [Boletus edulis BED1]|uniref:DUF6533 domain-containing protein n=1 Tax=Boletus edulis BED1 TaxID=1328754 RepID=A0AAD4BXJ7_BOLED|nr:hypothetical protein L210DRAFT_3536326 [Boletus edulis BED1]
MSSDALQSVVAAIQQGNYLSVALVAAVGYDYVLTFSSEIEHVWVSILGQPPFSR